MERERSRPPATGRSAEDDPSAEPSHDKLLVDAARQRRWIARQAATERPRTRAPDAAFDAAAAGGRSELPFRRDMERAFGEPLSDVNVHLGARAPMEELGAHAATDGGTIAFADAAPDRAVVAHEVTHVVQSRRGGSAGPIQKSAQVSTPGSEAEREADDNAARVVGGGAARVTAAPSAGLSRLGETEDELRERRAKLESTFKEAVSGEAFEKLDALADQLLQLKQLAHENNYGPLANELNKALTEWANAVDKIPEKSWPVEKRASVLGKLRSTENAAATFNKLGKDKWREFIDGKDQGLGPDVYDTGSNGGGADKGWRDSMEQADATVGGEIGEHLDVGGYARIHDVAVQHAKPQGFRAEHNDIGVPTRDTHRDLGAIEEMGPEPTVDISGKSDENGIYRANHKEMPRAEVQGRVQEILNEYYLNIGKANSKKEKLQVITNVHQRLERLHAFMDGTGRTDHFVLNKFLVENGFTPVILRDQNEVNHSTAATWQAHIERGMDEWMVFAKQEESASSRGQSTRPEYARPVMIGQMTRNMTGKDLHDGRALPQVEKEKAGREKFLASRSGDTGVEKPKVSAASTAATTTATTVDDDGEGLDEGPVLSDSPVGEQKNAADDEEGATGEDKVAEEPSELEAALEGKSAPTEKLLRFCIELGWKKLSEISDCRASDFRGAGVTEENWPVILEELGIEEAGDGLL